MAEILSVPGNGGSCIEILRRKLRILTPAALRAAVGVGLQPAAAQIVAY